MDSINKEAAKTISIIKDYNKVNIYPNPSAGKFLIEFNFDATDNANIEIVDILGNTVYASKYIVGAIKLPIDISNLAKGVYTVKVKYDNGKEDNRKVTIQ